jgi:tetratricopeptide (TPR) repeat protein
MTTRTEEMFLEAEADIRNSNYHEAFQKYEEILYEEPGYAPAHNSIGWIYKTQFDNYQKAEVHFRAAMKADREYPHPYFHFASLLLDLERYAELEKHLYQCLTMRSIDKSWVYYRYGMLSELNGQFIKAIEYYEKALINTMSNDKVKDYQTDIERCRIKLNVGR